MAEGQKELIFGRLITKHKEVFFYSIFPTRFHQVVSN